MSVSGVSRRGLMAGGLAVCALAAGPAASAPVVLFLPNARCRPAPLHRDFARQLARRGYHVVLPEPGDDQIDLKSALALAARQGADISRRGVMGYDGGAMAAHAALAADAGLKAGLAILGPLAANPIAGFGSPPGAIADRRMLSLDGRSGLLDVASAERLIDEAVDWLVHQGLDP